MNDDLKEMYVVKVKEGFNVSDMDVVYLRNRKKLDNRPIALIDSNGQWIETKERK